MADGMDTLARLRGTQPHHPAWAYATLVDRADACVPGYHGASLAVRAHPDGGFVLVHYGPPGVPLGPAFRLLPDGRLRPFDGHALVAFAEALCTA
jgi:hypothetical protein